MFNVSVHDAAFSPSDSRQEKGALLTSHNKITSRKKPNPMKTQLQWPQELKGF